MKNLPIREGLGDFYPYKIIETENYDYIIYANVSGFILIMRIDKNTNEYLYANAGTDYEYAKLHYADFDYVTISELLK